LITSTMSARSSSPVIKPSGIMDGLARGKGVDLPPGRGGG
jgi:hypothetical protein